ncbi:MAG TPA: CheR family methyltransferase [Rhodocyclaceae bacterium]|nr:CheR family methyltransferase [Rhodocyclaceae bacterium]
MTRTGAGRHGQITDSQPLPAEVQRLLVQRVGLRLSAGDWSKAEHLLRARAPRRFPSLAAYCASLSPSELHQEVERIAAQLTPGETFFFRDHGQFELLRFELLPELIAARRGRKTLRLWSAGCATGEEAYSLAMVTDMVLPERRDWQITIIGTDINEEALAKARRGRYGRWSFRLAPASLQGRYFHREGEQWTVNPDIRAMVTFRPGNLVSDPLPDPLLRDLDLILCRNVLIYLEPEAVHRVAAKLTACLADGAYLLTGHTELMGVPLAGLDPRLFPEGVAYQRTRRPLQPLPPAPALPIPAAPPMAAPRPRPIPQPAPAAPVPPPTFREARALADRGDYPAAEAACLEALQADPLVPAPHFLLAQLAQLRGDYPAAEERLKRTLYLDPKCVAAYLELAALHERAGDNAKAQARRRAALGLLRTLPAESRVEPFEASAGQLADWLAQMEAL